MPPIVDISISDQRGTSSSARGEITDPAILKKVCEVLTALTDSALIDTPTGSS